MSTNSSPAPSPTTRRAAAGGEEVVAARPPSADASGPPAASTHYGVAEAEVVGTGDVPDGLAGRGLLVDLVRDGEVVAREPLDAVRDRHVAARAGLPLSATQLSRGEPVIETLHV